MTAITFEYLVKSYTGISDEDVTAEFNQLRAEGWEVLSFSASGPWARAVFGRAPKTTGGIEKRTAKPVVA